MTPVTQATSLMDRPAAPCRLVRRRFPTCAIIPPKLSSCLPRKSIRIVFVPLLVLLFALSVAACGSIKVTAQTDVPQRDARGQPLQVVLRFYQLSSKDRFQKADFLALFRNDQKLLDKDLLWRKEMTLLPHSELVLKEGRKKGAKYLGV